MPKKANAKKLQKSLTMLFDYSLQWYMTKMRHWSLYKMPSTQSTDY